MGEVGTVESASARGHLETGRNYPPSLEKAIREAHESGAVVIIIDYQRGGSGWKVISKGPLGS